MLPHSIFTKIDNVFELFQNAILYPSVAKVLGEKFIELGNLLLISLVVTEALQIHIRAMPIRMGFVGFLLCYTMGVLILRNGKETQ